ncbi:unnamed protein product, partial [Laminaria digitata]
LLLLQGFTVDGKVGSADKAESYVYKCIYVQAMETDADAPLVGFVMEGLTIKNCGGECVRLMDYVTGAEISGNTIQDCGIHDYKFDWGSKNGEGIYIGTSSRQWKNGETGCHDNVVRGNRIKTNANECVDIKEGSTGNIVDSNICTAQMDANSGCYNSRGDDNTFCYNIGENCVGAGVRLGGADVNGHQYGLGNNVYGNDFNHVGFGAIKVNAIDQGDVCGNTCEDGDCEISGEHGSGIISETWNQTCYNLHDRPSSSTSSVSILLTRNVSTISSSSPSASSSSFSFSSSSSSSSSSSISSPSTSSSITSSNSTAISNSTSTSSDASFIDQAGESASSVSSTAPASESTAAAAAIVESGQDSDDYGNDYGDDIYSDDEYSPTKQENDDDDVADDDDNDDYGNDYGDDFYSDDDGSADRRMPPRGLLRGGRV